MLQSERKGKGNEGLDRQGARIAVTWRRALTSGVLAGWCGMLGEELKKMPRFESVCALWVGVAGEGWGRTIAVELMRLCVIAFWVLVSGVVAYGRVAVGTL